MALDVSGKYIKHVGTVTGEGKNGPWKKAEFLIEYIDGQYPKQVAFTLWGDKSDIIQRLNPGDQVTVSFNAESREYNGRYFTELRAWRVQAGSSESASNVAPEENNSQPQPINAPLPASGADDDLPF
ncbi:MAG: DUF3127 domain-containing protein [Bacteroidetes bacterium]|nr:DUF3127 domain-containing protein [Bacteroidota bacterium]